MTGLRNTGNSPLTELGAGLLDALRRHVGLEFLRPLDDLDGQGMVGGYHWMVDARVFGLQVIVGRVRS